MNDNHGSERYIAGRFRESLNQDEPYYCKDCGRAIYCNKWRGRNVNDVLILHHEIPLLWGGTSAPDNLVLLCNECHNKRHAEFRLKPELPLFRERIIVGYRKGSVFTDPARAKDAE